MKIIRKEQPKPKYRIAKTVKAKKTLPVKYGKAGLRAAAKTASKPEQNFFLKRYPHERLVELQELHDNEGYSFFEQSPGGYVVRTVKGYMLKHCWDMHERAFMDRTPVRLRHMLPKDLNWVEVELPNGKVLHVQPRSSTPSYFKRRA